MVKKVDSQGTKDDSNDANKLAVPRSNYQLQKALKRKKVTKKRCRLISLFCRIDKTVNRPSSSRPKTN